LQLEKLPYSNYIEVLVLQISKSKVMAKETKVIHVHLIFKKTSRFFGSISAIYSEFTAEEIGITEETLRHKGLSDGVSFATKKAIIQQGVLIRSARK
jgi:hypothetical protein